jgi:hypothetical protein
MDYTMVVGEGQHSTPLLTVGSFCQWLSCQIYSAPEATLKSLKKLLADGKEPLLIPSTEENFQYTVIPNECLAKGGRRSGSHTRKQRKWVMVCLLVPPTRMPLHKE